MKETIIALATPPGRSAVALLRMSGEKAFKILSKISKIPEKKLVSHKVQLAKIYDEDGRKIDEALVWAMKGPKTYTGEATVEISTHGNPVVIHKIINAALKQGARLAQRGEFTKRAFLAGKLDLSQAEAVAQLIASQSTFAVEAALLHLEGALSKKIKNIRKTLLELLARIEAEIDYPEEVAELSEKQFLRPLKEAQGEIEALLKTNRQGALLKEGLKVVIAGAPNVGKSSLLNCLVGESKSIVTEIPGTTRDAIEAVLTIEGLPIRIIDTAGLRHAPDAVERLGIERTLAHVDTADLVLFVIDLSKGLSKKEQDKISELQKKALPMLLVGNKADKKKEAFCGSVAVEISALNGAGIKKLEKKLLKFAGWTMQKEMSSPLIIEARHKEKLFQADKALARTVAACIKKASHDLLTIDLKEAVVALGEITGDAVSEEVIANIFDNFCVGK